MNIVFLGILIILIPIAFASGGVVAVRKAMAGGVREGHNEVLGPLFLTTGTIYAVLLGFLVVTTWASYDQAKATCDLEASAISTMYRQTCGMPPQEQVRMRLLLRDYTKAVVPEWKIQTGSGGVAPQARMYLAQMYREYSAMPPEQAASPINSHFLDLLDEMATARNTRTLMANEQLPGILWLGLFLGAAIVVGLTFPLYMESFWPHVLMSAIMAGMIGTLLFVTLLLNQPFRGPLALTVEPYTHALGVMDSVDKGA